MILAVLLSCGNFLKLLKHSGAFVNDLLCFYTSVVRPVLEYACPVWHSSLTAGQHETLESLQKRTMRIIFNHDDYTISLIIAGIDNLETRREHLTEQFFLRNVLNEKSSHCTICCPTSVTSTLWTDFATQKHLKYHKLELKDSKKSFIPYSLHISNSIYGRYTLFNWLLVLAETLYI